MDYSTRIAELVAERKRRDGQDDLSLLEGTFPQQRDFILDKSRRKLVFCPRRAGKSWALALIMVMTGFKFPGCTIFYMGMTVSSAKETLFHNIMEPINNLHDLGLVFVQSQTKPQIRFPNGSVINVVGVDSSEKQKTRLLGGKAKLSILDESQDIRVNIDELLNKIVKYTLIDQKGQFIMAGTPSDHTDTYFYEKTKNGCSDAEWKFFSWSGLDNPYMKEQLMEDFEIEKSINPYYEDTTYYKQMFLGEWVLNRDNLVYHYSSEKNFVEALPHDPKEYIYNMGVDIGFVDADAFVVGAYHPHERYLYIVEVQTQLKNDAIATGHTIQYFRDKYKSVGGLRKIVIDAADKKSVETMRQRMRLPLEAAEKFGKFDHISMMNMDLESGIIKLLPAVRVHLRTEWDRLIWDRDNPGKEDRRFNNHCADACLYLWKICHNWNPTDKPVEVLGDDGRVYRPKLTMFQQLENRMDNYDQQDYKDFFPRS